MDQLTIRQTTADLPRFDEQAALEPVSSLGTGSRLISDFQFGDTTLRSWDLAEAQLLHGRIRALQVGRVTITSARMDSVEFTGCNLSSLRWAGGKISRVRFDTCKLLGARLEEMTMEHVVFTDCKLDYTTFDRLQAVGPVLFAGCSLREAELIGCNMAGCLFDDCDLHLTGFGPGSYRRCDLRGNDLSAVIGTAHLKRVIIDRSQTMQLGEALAAELAVTFGDEVPDC